MRCPSCSKFVGNEEAEPEVQSVELSDGTVTAEVRITNNCADCSEELTEATFSFEQDVSEALAKHTCTKKDEPEFTPEFSAEENSAERTSRSGYMKKGVWVDGGGRYAKTFYGASLEVNIKCDHCDESVETVTFSEDVQASSMDQLN